MRRSAAAATVAAVGLFVAGLTLGAPVRADCDGTLHVTLDIGHSPAAPGATSARGRPEYAFNKRFVDELEAALEADRRFTVDVINADGAGISLARRGALVNTIDRGVFLSIHHDSVQPRYLSQWTVAGQTRSYSDLFRGFSLFVSNRSVDPHASTTLASKIGARLRAAGFRPSLHHGEAIPGENRPVVDARNGVFRYDGLAVLRNARVPAVLIEVGIIVNRAEEEALESQETRRRSITAIIDALAGRCPSRG